MQIRDRVKELRRVPASQLRPNPLNWRTHPEAQRDALKGVLAKIGFAGLRVETLPDAEIPVLILDVNEEEAKELLLTHDPLASMAESNEEALRSLLEEVSVGSEELEALLNDLAQPSAVIPQDEPKDTAPQLGGMEYRIVVRCKDEGHQTELMERFSQEGLACQPLIS